MECQFRQIVSFLYDYLHSLLSSYMFQDLLSLDIILGGLEDSAELFPASNVLFTKSTVLGSYILDLSDYIPNLISRCVLSI